MPLAVILFAWIARLAKVNATASQVAALLTGIFALQKTLSAWFAQRQQYATWYNTSYSLKCLYSTFKQKWAGHAEPPSLDMLADMRKAADAGRDFVKAERMAFYQALTPPTFDVLSMITTQQTTVATWLSNFIPAQKKAPATDAAAKNGASNGAGASDSADPSTTQVGADQPQNDNDTNSAPADSAQPSSAQSGPAMIPVGYKEPPAPAALTDEVVTLCYECSPLSNAADIDQLFAGNFIDWFNTTMKGSAPFLQNGHNQIQTASTTRQHFKDFWDRIPRIFNADTITVPQFVALMCINIQECAGNFWRNPELVGITGYPGLKYCFDTIPHLKASYNTLPGNFSAWKLFGDSLYVNAHKASDNGYVQVVSGGIDPAWKKDTWPSQFDTHVDPKNGFIMQADFYKLRGRGVIQTTGRSNYSSLLQYLFSQAIAQNSSVMTRVSKLRPPGAVNWSPAPSSLDQVLIECTADELDDLFNDADVLAAGVYTHSKDLGYFSLSTVAGTLGASSDVAGSYYRVAACINRSSAYRVSASEKMIAMTVALARQLNPNVGVPRPSQTIEA